MVAEPPGYYQASGPLVPSSEERTWAWISHAGSILASVVAGLGFVCPLIIMLTKGTESSFVRRHAVESLNFWISLYIYTVICFVLLVVIVGVLLFVALGLFALVTIILGTVHAANGEEYRYPFCIRLVR